jgi:putative tryptophan/tyrosine transport system substrate-binding protein
MAIDIGRRQFISVLGGAAVEWPLPVRSQQTTMPVVGFITGGSDGPLGRTTAAFRKGLNEIGYVDSQNVTLEFHWLEGRYDNVPALVADLVRRQVTVIATPATPVAALAAKAATSTIPIVFSAAQDPVQLGLIASLARPGGNVTGINYFSSELVAKRLRLLHDLVPKAVRVAVLVNPANALTAEPTLREVQEAAHIIGLQIEIFNAKTIDEIDATFATLANERPDALFVGGDAFFFSRREQIAILAARAKIPAVFPSSDAVAVGGLMGYRSDLPDSSRQVGVYTGRILKGAKPADLPVLQSTKFVFATSAHPIRWQWASSPASIGRAATSPV